MLFSIKAHGTTCKLQVDVRNFSRKPVTVSPSVTLCQLCEVVDTRPLSGSKKTCVAPLQKNGVTENGSDPTNFLENCCQH